MPAETLKLFEVPMGGSGLFWGGWELLGGFVEEVNWFRIFFFFVCLASGFLFSLDEVFFGKRGSH